MTKHPAIEAVRKVIGRAPPKKLWPEIIAAIGDEPDLTKLALCYLTWKQRGYNPTNYPTNYIWALDWYANGISERRRRYGRSNSEKLEGYKQLFDEWDSAPEEAEKYIRGDQHDTRRTRVEPARPEGRKALRGRVAGTTGQGGRKS